MGLQDIYDRLHAVDGFHPGSVELFDDFLMEAGDIVQVLSDGESFDLPIFSQHMEWFGSMMNTVQSTGNKERTALPPLQRREKNSIYRTGKRITRQDEILHGYDTRFIQDERNIGMQASAIGVKLDENGNPIIGEDGKYVWDDENGAEIYARLLLSPNRAQLVTALNDGQGAQISGSKIDLSAQGTVLIQAINNRPGGQSAVTIEADKIDLRGYVTTSYIDAEKAVVDALISSSGYSGSMSVTGTVSAGTVAAGYVQGAQLWLLDNNGDRYAQITDSGIKDLHITPPSEGSNVYTLEKQTFLSGNTWLPVGTFSRATSLRGEWSGGTYTVRATPQGNIESTSPVLKGSGNGSDNFAVVLRETDSSTTDLLSKRIYLKSVTGAVNACESSDGTGILATIPVSGGGGYTPADIRIGNITNESGSHSTGDGTVLNDLGSAISRAGSRTYVRFIADLNGYSGSGKVYYIPIN